MYTIPETVAFHATIAQPVVKIEYWEATNGLRTALAVEIPFMFFALCAVVARVYSRLAIKKKLAPDDVLIILGTVC